MKKALHFGAGKIGKGFIGELLYDSGYHITFADVVEPAVDQINKDKKYYLFKINHNYEEKLIDNIDAINSIKNPEKVVEAICEADVITTSVMATNLPKIAPLIEKGLKKRAEKNIDKPIVMACENAIMGTDILKSHLPGCEDLAFFPNTAVDRIVFDGHHNGKEGIEVGDAFELVIEQDKLPYKAIKGAEYVKNLKMYLQRKIYIINCGHALSAYYGFVAGYNTVQEALNDPKYHNLIEKAVLESANALVAEYGFKLTELKEYIDKMFFKRFASPGLVDSIYRVGQEPIRKLSPEDRIIGPANMCKKHNLDNDYLLKGAAGAFKFKNSEDKQAVEIQNFIKENGIDAAITKYTGIKEDTDMFNTIKAAYNEQN